MRVDQWLPTLHRGDAIGDSARLMQAALRRSGFTSELYALELDPDSEPAGRRFSEWREGTPEDVVVLHYALPSPLTPALRARRGRNVLLHHNITPARFFDGFDPELARICRQGRRELASLASDVELALGDSEFNRRELEQAGFSRTGVLPIFLDFERYREAPNPVLLRQLGDGRVNVLFVGRITPNKCPEDLIRFASYWTRFIDTGLRLLLVGKLPRHATGSGEPLPRHYFDALQAFAYEEGLTPAQVVFPGHVPHADLLAYYASARLFLSMSEHEGFGVPLVEAMLIDVPVLAYAAAAVPDTLGGAGVQFDRKRFPEVAELAWQLCHEPSLRKAVLVRQRRRCADFAPAAVEAQLLGHLASLGVRP